MNTDSKICSPKIHKCMSPSLMLSVMVTRPMQKKAEKLNGRTAMLGFVAALISYATSGSVFFFGIFGF